MCVWGGGDWGGHTFISPGSLSPSTNPAALPLQNSKPERLNLGLAAVEAAYSAAFGAAILGGLTGAAGGGDGGAAASNLAGSVGIAAFCAFQGLTAAAAAGAKEEKQQR